MTLLLATPPNQHRLIDPIQNHSIETAVSKEEVSDNNNHKDKNGW